MPREEAPAFFFYPKDYFSSTKVAVMDVQHEGCYVRLLAFQWLDGSVPEDLEALARMCKMDKKRMEQLWPLLAPCFEPHPDLPGRLVNPRLERERAAKVARKQERSESGQRGAKRRWLSDGSAIAQPSQTNGSAITEPSPQNRPAIDQPSSTAMANDGIASSYAIAPAQEEIPIPAESGRSPRKRDEFIDGCWASSDEVDAPRTPAGLLHKWRKDIFNGNGDWMLRCMRELAPRGGLHKGDAYTVKALQGMAAGNSRQLDGDRASALAGVAEEWRPDETN